MANLERTLTSNGPIPIVEDDFFIGQEILQALRASGAQTAGPIPDIEAAARIVDTQQISLALLDIKLGSDLVFPLASRLSRRSVPFVFASGYGRDFIPREFADVPIFEKPFKAPDVAKALMNGSKHLFPPRVFTNSLLARFPADFMADLRRHASLVELQPGAVLQKPGAPGDHVWFIENGLCILSLRSGGVEVGMIGREGAFGLEASLALRNSPPPPSFHCVVGAAGQAVRISAGVLQNLMERSPAARSLAMSYLRVLHTQTASTLESAATQPIEKRVARWVLMASDRIGPVVPVTHDMLALYLGVRRAGVTEALQDIEASDAIERKRGCVFVRDRTALEARAGAYGDAESAYRRLPTASL